MKTASKAYKASMAAQLRNRSYVNISFGNIDVSAESDAKWEGSCLENFFYKNIDHAHIYKSTAATLELNRWVLDGTQSIILDTGGDYGWTSAGMSNEDGEFELDALVDTAIAGYSEVSENGTTTAGDVELVRDFTRIHALSGITFTFDSNTNEYPLEVTLTYDEGEETEATVTFSPDSAEYPVQLPSGSVSNVKVTFTKMLPYRRARVQTTIWGIGTSYTNEDLVSVVESNDVDPLSRRLPQEKLTYTILDFEHNFDPDNPMGVYSTINRGAPITIAYGYELDDGSIEWLQSDTYALDNRPSFKDNMVTFTGIGLLATMTNTYYKGALGSTNFYDLAVDVLEDANLTPTPEGDDPWDVDVSLKTMYTTTPMPIQTHAACLQMIAHACNCRLFTDEENIIHIKPFGVSPVGVFGGDFSDDGHVWYSSWKNVDYGVGNTSVYATLELNRWILGTPQIIAGENTVASGYVSSQVSDEDGEIDATWRKTFYVTHDIPRIILTFDDVLDEYPSEITVKYYGEDDTLLDTVTKTPTAPTHTIDTEVEDCLYFTVEVTETPIPYRRSRVTKAEYFETDFALTLDSVNKNSYATSKIERLRNVIVNEYSLSQQSDNVTKLYEADTSDTEVHIEFATAKNVAITVTGGSNALVDSAVVGSAKVGQDIDTFDIYAAAADLHLTPGSKHILAEGLTLTEGAIVHTYPYSSSGEDDIEENVLISNESMAQAHAAHVGQYLSYRNTYDANYRGNPELEVGDIISVGTPYNNVVYGLILKDDISFNGSIKGSLKVKGLV